jgi:diguanylate cyclase (GGDEF)-like protein
VTAIVQQATERELDLVITQRAFIASNLRASNATFQGWAASVQVLQRYPELQGLNSIFLVSTAGQPARCEQHFILARTAALATPANVDLCSTALGTPLMAARDSGLGEFSAYQLDGQSTLEIFTPIYSGGAVPSTVAARRAAFLGWSGTLIDPATVLALALRNSPGVGVTIAYHVGPSNVSFSSAASVTGPDSLQSDVQSGWTVRTFGTIADGSWWTHSNSLLVLTSGVIISLLLALLVLVLGTGRARALQIVVERTGELRHQALHDALTDLPNRALITDRIEQLLARNRRHGTVGSALYVDLDEFKNVNDTLGHEAGDRLLVAVAARLESTLRDADTIGRMGGDEFIVLIDGATLNVAPELVAQRLLEVMRQPFELDDAPMPLIVTASIGIAMGDRCTPGELLRDADVALYQAKAAGKNRYELFQPEMQTEVSHRIEMEFDLRSALDSKQFRLVYQPIYKLDDLSLVGVEALLRWDHPIRGLVGPDEFIPVLEQTGQIREVGRWVLNEACRQMAAWHAAGNDLSVSVNVSGRQLDDDAIVEHIREALAVTGLDATSLIVEVTESALMRNTIVTAHQLQAIKALGVRIAVDDFGTGYSSLAYLQQFAVDCLKIDRTFTKGVTESRAAKALLGTLVQLGKDLDLKTLAEGVETADQINHLRSQRVDEVQGFLLARPLDPATLERDVLAPARAAATPV